MRDRMSSPALICSYKLSKSSAAVLPAYSVHAAALGRDGCRLEAVPGLFCMDLNAADRGHLEFVDDRLRARTPACRTHAVKLLF